MKNLTLQQIKFEINRRVESAIIPVLIEKITRFHAKNYFLKCDCDYCLTKMHATKLIGEMPKKNAERFNDLKESFRKKLNALIQE